MVKIISGKNWKGDPCIFPMNELLKENMDRFIKVIRTKDFDLVTVIAGLCGAGKSNFAINQAKYCDPNFTEKNIAFTSDEFVELTNKLPKNSSIILDESFASLNTRLSMTKEFLQVINHLQIIRQKNLFIFLCLPDYFDLSKGVAIQRANMLFVVYGEEFGDRGKFACYDRERKKMLYILGQKYRNYHAVKPNFRGTFERQTAIDEKVYVDLKIQHLKQQEKKNFKEPKYLIQRNRLVEFCYSKGISVNEIADCLKVSNQDIYLRILNKEKNLKEEGLIEQ